MRSCWRTAPTKSWSEGEGAGIVLPSVFTSIVIPGREFTEGFPMAKVTKVDEKASDEEVVALISLHVIISSIDKGTPGRGFLLR